MIFVMQQIYRANDYSNTTNFQPMIVVMQQIYTANDCVVLQQSLAV
jgi:hypothetical protein